MAVSRTQERVHTPTVLQIEAVECGAAALGIVLAHYGRYVPLEELRVACGVSRDGSKASNVLRAARTYGLVAKGFKKDVADLRTLKRPAILFWNFNHFLVLEGYGNGVVYLNDPDSGPRTVSEDEFDESYTGVVLTFEPGPDFQPGGAAPKLIPALARRLVGSEMALTYVILVGLALVIPGLAAPLFVKVFVNNYLVSGMRSWLLPIILGLALTAVIQAALTWVQQTYLMRIQTKLAVGASSRFFWHILRLPVEFFAQRFAGEIGARLQINDQVAQLLSGQLASTVLSFVQILFYLVVMIIFSPLLTAIAVGMSLINAVALRYVSRKRIDGSRQYQLESGRLLGISMSGLQIIETLKATGTESDFFAKWAGRQAKTLNVRQGLAIYSTYLDAVPPLLSGLSTVAVLGIGALRVMDGVMTAGTLVAFQMLMASFSGPVGQLVTLGSTLQTIEGGMNRLDDVLGAQVDQRLDAPADHAGGSLLEATGAKLDGSVELQSLNFGFSPLDPPLVADFSLRLKPGDRVAIVGGSGSGKSTVAKLVSGLYHPWDGQIVLEGQDRDTVPLSILANSVAVVDQDIFMFEGTIRDNITLWDSTIDDVTLIRAAKDACIHADIVARPGGYDSVVTEGGGNFSGGQRQRLEIARALVTEPTILILDEATSALDPVVEREIDANLRRRGCTCLIVAHRLSTIRDCDLIVVMDRGSVVEQGTHEELMARRRDYYRLITAE